MDEKPKSRTPDYVVKAMDKSTGYGGKVGAAWKNADGSLSVALNAFVSLIASPNLVITIFPPGES